MRALAVFALAVLCVAGASDARSLASRLSLAAAAPHAARDALVGNGTYPYDIRWFEQTLDHFNFANDRTFQQRYLYSDKYWVLGDRQGPMFFYTGNEGDIEWFCANTGFLWEVAQEFNALVVFAEHRYYGKTMPFGNSSFDLDKVGFLTTPQALADFAVLIRQLKTDLNVPHMPVIAFGGSYGGMLASWFRMHYPNVVDGAIAASAPIVQFTGITPAEVFNRIATSDFTAADKRCSASIRASFDTLQGLLVTAEGRAQASAALGLCAPVVTDADVTTLMNWLEGGLTYLAMTDYPYPTSFLEPMPGWPVKVSCDRVVAAIPAAASQPLAVLSASISVYYNFSGAVSCYDILSQATQDLGTLGWDYQSCTEMVMPMATNGVDDMFPKSDWNITAFTQYCQKRWGVTPRPDWAATHFWGRDLSAASNIVFSNGMLDPWSGGSILESVSESVVAVNIAEGAHHLDLRASNPADPQSVIAAREVERAFIRRWIEEKAAKH